MLTIRPSTLHEANRIVEEWHRHSRPVRGCRFTLAAVNSEVVGVAIVGRPVAPELQNEVTAEVLRAGSPQAAARLGLEGVGVEPSPAHGPPCPPACPVQGAARALAWTRCWMDVPTGALPAGPGPNPPIHAHQGCGGSGRSDYLTARL